jgi:hypothetical protein
MTKPLIETNPYLKDKTMREQLISRSVRTSCGVEGIKAPSHTSRIKIAQRKDKRIYKIAKG